MKPARQVAHRPKTQISPMAELSNAVQKEKPRSSAMMLMEYYHNSS